MGKRFDYASMLARYAHAVGYLEGVDYLDSASFTDEELEEAYRLVEAEEPADLYRLADDEGARAAVRSALLASRGDSWEADEDAVTEILRALDRYLAGEGTDTRE